MGPRTGKAGDGRYDVAKPVDVDGQVGVANWTENLGFDCVCVADGFEVWHWLGSFLLAHGHADVGVIQDVGECFNVVVELRGVR